MSAIRKYRYPIFIGAGVIAAGANFYFAQHVSSEQTRGAIGQREAYRDGQVSAADVKANPGSAPVAMKALLESKEFKALAKNAAFQELLASSSFQTLAQNTHFINLLQNESFLRLTRNESFVHYLSSGAMSELSQQLTRNNSAQLTPTELTRSLTVAHAQALAGNEMFQSLMRSSSFLGLAQNQSNVQALVNMMQMQSFASLSQNAQFTNLLSQSSFQNALLQGSALNLSSQLTRQ
jgi:hypothetical protein